MKMLFLGSISAILFIVLIKLINAIFSSRKLLVWVEVELGDVVNSLLFILFFAGAAAFMISPASSEVVDSVVRMAYGKGVDDLIGSFEVNGEVFSTDRGIYENTYCIQLLILSELAKIRQASTWAQVMYTEASQQTLTLSGPSALDGIVNIPFPVPGFLFGGSYDYTPYGDGTLISSSVLTGFTEESALQLVSFTLLAFLLMVSPVGFGMITVGFILRMLPGMKAVGSSLAAIGISFAIFYPLLLVGEGIVMLADKQPFQFSYVSEDPALIERFVTDLNTLSKGGTRAFQSGLLNEPLLKIGEDQSLYVVRYAFPSPREVKLFDLKAYLQASADLSLYGSIVAPLNFLLVIVMVRSIMAFLGERDTILDFFLINYT